MDIGVDEAGRGALAGPVVAAAVSLGPHSSTLGFMDSKALSAAKRESLFLALLNSDAKIGVGMVSQHKIDDINILNATMLAMEKAVIHLNREGTVIIDGNKVPDRLKDRGTAEVKGDQKYQCISAASIVAKVVRDRLMVRYSRQYPEYELAVNKGYGTEIHRLAILTHGRAPIHRKTFNVSIQTRLF